MNLLLKLIVFIVPTIFLLLFFMILTNEDTYPGADYDQFQIPEFELKVLDNSMTVDNDLLDGDYVLNCLLYTSPSPRDKRQSRMPSSA